jgi:5-methylcytosine-specific restriction enzyme subunit McrC
MREPLEIVESIGTVLPISDEEAMSLTLLGRRLALQSRWWGESEDEEEPVERSVISCRKQPDNTWVVRVREAVGTLGVGDLTIQVKPKIPREHFLYLALRSGIIPRVDEQIAGVDLSGDLGDLIAIWFLGATEKLLRGELSRGYDEMEDELTCVHGELRPLETARLYYSGRATAVCRFESFSQNIPLNRVIKEAAQIVASGPCFSPLMRGRARRILTRMEDVGAFVPADLRVSVDRLTHRYKQSLAFAKYLISHSAVQLAHSTHLAWSFLIRTPELMEEGVRSVLREGLSPQWEVKKERRWIPGSNVTLNPDIVVDSGLLVGDVKYKLVGSDWARADLYQVVAFAAGFEARAAALIYFDVQGVSAPPSIEVGRLPVHCLTWRSGLGVRPEVAADILLEEVKIALPEPARKPAIGYA